jgi:hypothetical protein
MKSPCITPSIEQSSYFIFKKKPVLAMSIARTGFFYVKKHGTSGTIPFIHIKNIVPEPIVLS